ncbi:MAG: aminotransferase class III-fold pyridoxal phosphate-dependent enzyme [Dongiaceae bacterium]
MNRAAALFGAGRLPKIAWGKGVYVHDSTGKRYIDGSGGPAVFCFGHGNEEVTAAIAAHLQKVAHGYRYTFTSDPLEQLTEIVADACGGGLDHMVFVSSGSCAVAVNGTAICRATMVAAAKMARPNDVIDSGNLSWG